MKYATVIVTCLFLASQSLFGAANPAGPAGSARWGGIRGDINDQNDLMRLLEDYVGGGAGGNITTTSPIHVDENNNVTIDTASDTNAGALSAADHAAFNSKQSALTNTTDVNLRDINVGGSLLGNNAPKIYHEIDVTPDQNIFDRYAWLTSHDRDPCWGIMTDANRRKMVFLGHFDINSLSRRFQLVQYADIQGGIFTGNALGDSNDIIKTFFTPPILDANETGITNYIDDIKITTQTPFGERSTDPEAAYTRIMMVRNCNINWWSDGFIASSSVGRRDIEWNLYACDMNTQGDGITIGALGRQIVRLFNCRIYGIGRMSAAGYGYHRLLYSIGGSAAPSRTAYIYMYGGLVICDMNSLNETGTNISNLTGCVYSKGYGDIYLNGVTLYHSSYPKGNGTNTGGAVYNTGPGNVYLNNCKIFPSNLCDINDDNATNGIIYISNTDFSTSNGSIVYYTDPNVSWVNSNTNMNNLKSLVLAQGDLLYATGPNTLVVLSKPTDPNSVLMSKGTSNNPTWRSRGNASDVNLHDGETHLLATLTDVNVGHSQNGQNRTLVTAPSDANLFVTAILFYNPSGSLAGATGFNLTGRGSSVFSLVPMTAGSDPCYMSAALTSNTLALTRISAGTNYQLIVTTGSTADAIISVKVWGILIP